MTPPAVLALQFDAHSNPGKVREENQDRMTQFTCPFGEVFIVADGMGGHMGGATAAQAVVQDMQACLQSTEPTRGSLADALRYACQQVNTNVYNLGRSGDPSVAGMGSTVVVAVFTGQDVVVAHVGDSRAYLFRDNRLQQITKDHTKVQQYIDANMMSEAEARNHPESSFLTQAIGQRPDVLPEIQDPLPVRPGDAFLLCSDGLSGYIDQPVIEASIRGNPEPKAAVRDLIRLALEAGGEDNVTVQFILPCGPIPEIPLVREGSSVAGRWRLPVILLSVALIATVATVAFRRKAPPPKSQQTLVLGADIKGPNGPRVDPAPGAPPAVPAPAPKSVTAGPPASRSARPRADAEVGGSSRVEAYTPAPPQVPAPETPPAKSIPRVVLLFDKKQQDTANALKKEITDLLGDAVTVEPLTFTKATAGAVDPKTLVFARMLTGNPIVDKIAAKYGAAKKYGKILNKQFPQADVVVVIGTKEHVR